MDTVNVVKVAVLGHYLLDVEFSDGVRRELDLRGELEGGVFEPLKDPASFSQAFVDACGVEWPNGASLALEYLYEDAKDLVRT